MRYFVDAGQAIGGLSLGIAMTLAATISSVAILNSTVLATTRIPFAMAQDGYLPAWLTRRHGRYGTPWVAITLSAAIYSLFSIQTLAQLISLYVWLRIATSMLTFLTAWRMRKKHPEMARPFRIPGGRKGLAYVVGGAAGAQWSGAAGKRSIRRALGSRRPADGSGCVPGFAAAAWVRRARGGEGVSWRIQSAAGSAEAPTSSVARSGAWRLRERAAA